MMPGNKRGGDIELFDIILVFKDIRDCSHMSTYRFGPSETRYLLCHNNIIIWRPRYLIYYDDIINGYKFHI